MKLSNHVGAAAPLVQNAIGQLNSVIAASMGKRDLSDFLMNSLGLGSVWSEIQTLGGNVVAQLFSIAGQLLFAGKEIFNQVKAIFSQLASDLTNHVGAASPLVQNAISQVTQRKLLNVFTKK